MTAETGTTARTRLFCDRQRTHLDAVLAEIDRAGATLHNAGATGISGLIGRIREHYTAAAGLWDAFSAAIAAHERLAEQARATPGAAHDTAFYTDDAGAHRPPEATMNTNPPPAVHVPAPPSAEALGADTRDVEAQIRAAYTRLAQQPGTIITLAELRDALPADLDRETIDAALSKLGTHTDVHLSPRSDHHHADLGDQAAALPFGGAYQHQVSIDTHPDPAAILQRVRSTDAVTAASILAPLDERTVAYLAEQMGVDTTGPVDQVRRRVGDRAAANHASWRTDAEQGQADGTLLYRADTDPAWVASWTDEDHQAAHQAAQRLLARAETEPSWAYIRDRALRWAHADAAATTSTAPQPRQAPRTQPAGGDPADIAARLADLRQR